MMVQSFFCLFQYRTPSGKVLNHSWCRYLRIYFGRFDKEQANTTFKIIMPRFFTVNSSIPTNQRRKWSDKAKGKWRILGSPQVQMATTEQRKMAAMINISAKRQLAAALHRCHCFIKQFDCHLHFTALAPSAQPAGDCPSVRMTTKSTNSPWLQSRWLTPRSPPASLFTTCVGDHW